jgi:hypothetical protein
MNTNGGCEMPSLAFLENKFKNLGQKPVIPQGKQKNEDDKKNRVLLRRRA